MRFRILKGQHVEDGQVFEAGDIIETEVDLVKAFGAPKFQRLDIMLSEEEKAFEDYGVEITSQFNGAKEINKRIFRNGRKYLIIDGADGMPVHKDDITRKQDVISLLRQLRQ